MTSACTTQDALPPSPAAADPPITSTQFAELMRRLDTIERRSVRTESKVMRLMEHHGLDGHGNRLNEETTA